MASSTVVCVRCGGSSFDETGESQYAVCARCGLESQQMLNMAFDDWAEEVAGYQSTGGRLFKRREHKERAKKVREAVRVPTYGEAVRALGKVFQAHVAALSAMGFDVSTRADDVWKRFAALADQVTDVNDEKPPPPPTTSPLRKRRIDPWRHRARCSADVRREIVSLESVLPAVYLACRAEGAPVSAFDVERWASDGALPYFSAAAAALFPEEENDDEKDDEKENDFSPSELLGEAFRSVGTRFLRPVRVPTATTIAVAAEARFSRLLATPFREVDLAGLARRFAADFAPTQKRQATRLATLASYAVDAPYSETTAAAAVGLACLRYGDVETWAFRERRGPSYAAVPKSPDDAASLPRNPAETIALFDLLDGIDAIPNEPFLLAKDEAAELARHLDDRDPSTPKEEEQSGSPPPPSPRGRRARPRPKKRRRRRRQSQGRLSAAPLVQLVPSSFVLEETSCVPVPSRAAVVEFLAHDLLAHCPPKILQDEIDRLEAALDRLVQGRLVQGDSPASPNLRALLDEEHDAFLKALS